MRNSGDLDYLTHIAAESARFAEVLRQTGADAAVPTCPEWNAEDLFWHLGEVQWFWGSVVGQGVTTTAEAEQLSAARPQTWAGVAEFFAAASRELLDVLAANDPGTPAWTWAEDQSVGFIRRRQAHEALIHRLDAELTAGHRTGMDGQLSADGVDEALRIMHGGDLPPWGALASEGTRTLRIRATDTGDSWFLTLGQFTGTDPADGEVYDQPGLRAAEADSGSHAAATIEGSAADLDCLLWRRPPIGELGRSGAPGVLADFDSLLAAGIS